ncbi:MAG: TRAP transporter small permease [Clostridiales bacterium]|nr:TRAP transporter small permease [Clostridiales bacterium]
MEGLKKVRKFIDTVLGFLCAFIFAAMVVIGTYQIVTRYFFNSPSTISEELLTYSFTWMALFSSALVFGKRDHMRMGFVADKLTGTKRMILELAIETLVLIFTAVILVYGGISITKLTMTQITASLGISMGVVYAAIPVAGVIILFYNVLNLIDIFQAKGVMPEPAEEPEQLEIPDDAQVSSSTTTNKK